MIRYILIFISTFSTITSAGQTGIPEHYSVLKEVVGDLDNDSQAEKAVVYNVESDTNNKEGIGRELVIFKKTGDNWIIWKRSSHAVLTSSDGGIMGDPFAGIEIKNNALLIHHAGGSNWKWNYTDEYILQNGDLILARYESAFGKQCEYQSEFDYDLNTGSITYKKEFEECENEKLKTVKQENESFIYHLQDKLTIENRKSKEIKIVSPQHGHELYL